jgi:hypothetical protein
VQRPQSQGVGFRDETDVFIKSYEIARKQKMSQLPQDAARQEHDAVVRTLCDSNNARFKVLCNVEQESYHIAGLFPDIILQDKNSDSALFIIEVRKNGGIATCLQQWKNIPKIPAVLYIVVPENDLSNTRAIAQVIGIQVKFGSYKIESNGVATVKYE